MGRTNAWTSQVDWHTGRWQPRSPSPGHSPWRPPLPRGILPKRPLTFFEVLDTGFRLLRFIPSLAIGAPLIVVTLGTLALTAAGTALTLTFLPFLADVVADDEAMTGFALLAQLGSFVLGLLSLGFVHFLAGLLAPGAENSFGARRTTLTAAWRALTGRRFRLVGAALLITGIDTVLLALLAGPAVAAGLLGAPIIGGVIGLLLLGVWVLAVVWLNLRLAFTGAAIAAEDAGSGAALARSWRLTGSGFWRTLGQLGLGYLLANQLIQLVISPFVFVVTIVLTAVLSTSGGDTTMMTAIAVTAGALVLALTAVSSAVLYGYFSCLVCVCYFDARMRSEGFDLVVIRTEEAAAS